MPPSPSTGSSSLFRLHMTDFHDEAVTAMTNLLNQARSGPETVLQNDAFHQMGQSYIKLYLASWQHESNVSSSGSINSIGDDFDDKGDDFDDNSAGDNSDDDDLSNDEDDLNDEKKYTPSEPSSVDCWKFNLVESMYEEYKKLLPPFSRSADMKEIPDSSTATSTTTATGMTQKSIGASTGQKDMSHDDDGLRGSSVESKHKSEKKKRKFEVSDESDSVDCIDCPQLSVAHQPISTANLMKVLSYWPATFDIHSHYDIFVEDTVRVCFLSFLPTAKLASFRRVNKKWYKDVMKLLKDRPKKPLKSNNELKEAVHYYCCPRKSSPSSRFKIQGTYGFEIGSWNVSLIEKFTMVFYGLEEFNEPIENWDTSNATSMECMFVYARRFNQPLAKWKTGKVKTMTRMFCGAGSFNQSIEGWDTHNLEEASFMFCEAASFNQPLQAWNTKNLKYAESTFNCARSFRHSLAGWNTSSLVLAGKMFVRSGVADLFKSNRKLLRDWEWATSKIYNPENKTMFGLMCGGGTFGTQYDHLSSDSDDSEGHSDGSEGHSDGSEGHSDDSEGHSDGSEGHSDDSEG